MSPGHIFQKTVRVSFQHYHYVYLCSQIQKIRKIFIIRSHLNGNLILKIKIICFSHAVLNRAVMSVREISFQLLEQMLYEKQGFINFISFSAEASLLFIHNYSHSKSFTIFFVVFKVRLSSWPKEVPGSWFSEFKRGKIVSALSHPSFIYSFMKNILSFETKRT